MTFWEREIVDTKNYTFFTRKWEASQVFMFYAHTISVYVLWLSIPNLHIKPSSQTRGWYKTLVQLPIIYASSVNWLPNLVLFIILNVLMICFSSGLTITAFYHVWTSATILIYLWYVISFHVHLFMYKCFIYHFSNAPCRDGKTIFWQCCSLWVNHRWFLRRLLWKKQYLVNVGVHCGLTIVAFYHVYFHVATTPIVNFIMIYTVGNEYFSMICLLRIVMVLSRIH